MNDGTKTDCTTTAFFRSSLCEQRGDRLTSSFGYTLTMNRTNDYIEPTRGFNLNFSQDIAGLGGDVNYLRNEFEGSMYHGFAPGWTLRSRLEVGYIDSWGDEGIRINDRFFKGGNSFRGFDVSRALVHAKCVTSLQNSSGLCAGTQAATVTCRCAGRPASRRREFSVPVLNSRWNSGQRMTRAA